MWRLLAICVLALGACATPSPPGEAAWSGLPMGAYSVRLEARDFGDYSALVFRPARRDARPAAIADVAHALCGGDDWGGPLLRRCLPEFADALEREGGDADALDRVAGSDLASSFEAPPARGRFPLIVLQGSVRGRGVDLMAFAEAAASRGYVVAVTALADPPAEFAFDAALMRELGGAVSEAVRVLASDPGVDHQRLALGGWSVGGASTALHALSDPDTDALVSFDGALTYAYGAALIREAPGYDPAAFSGALLLIFAGVPNAVAKDRGVADAMTNAARREFSAALSHAQFSDQHGSLREFALNSEGRAAYRAEYARVVAATLAFLDERLR